MPPRTRRHGRYRSLARLAIERPVARLTVHRPLSRLFRLSVGRPPPGLPVQLSLTRLIKLARERCLATSAFDFVYVIHTNTAPCLLIAHQPEIWGR